MAEVVILDQLAGASPPAKALLPLLFPLLFFLLLRHFTAGAGPSRTSRQRLPPSPPGLPLVGHAHLVGASPHVSLRRLALRHRGCEDLVECMGTTLALACILRLGTASGQLGNESLSAPMQLQQVAPLILVSGALNRILDMFPQPPTVAEKTPGTAGGPSIEAVEKRCSRWNSLQIPLKTYAAQLSCSSCITCACRRGRGQEHLGPLLQPHPAGAPGANTSTNQGADASSPFPRRRQQRTFSMSSEFVAMFSGPLSADVMDDLAPKRSRRQLNPRVFIDF